MIDRETVGKLLRDHGLGNLRATLTIDDQGRGQLRLSDGAQELHVTLSPEHTLAEQAATVLWAARELDGS